MSAIYDADGRVVASTGRETRRAIAVAEIETGAGGTAYGTIGGAIGWLAVGVSGAALAMGIGLRLGARPTGDSIQRGARLGRRLGARLVRRRWLEPGERSSVVLVPGGATTPPACSGRAPPSTRRDAQDSVRERSVRSDRSAPAPARRETRPPPRRAGLIRKYAIPSASRIEALRGSARLAFSSATVACALRPSLRCCWPCWKCRYASVNAPSP